MYTFKENNPYDNAVLEGLVSKYKIPKDRAMDVLKQYYPVVLDVYEKEVSPDRYVDMFAGIIKKGLSLEQVQKIVKPKSGGSVVLGVQVMKKVDGNPLMISAREASVVPDTKKILYAQLPNGRIVQVKTRTTNNIRKRLGFR